MLGGRYELDREIGRGGMGAVWLGHDSVLRRTVAVKQIGMAPGGSVPDLDRAEREARLAARVNHHNVVQVFDLVLEDGQQWLVMEHVDGPSLAGLITARGAVGAEELAPLVHQVAGALAAAHAHGIVHRDVKPSNILLTGAGVAKLSDFGVARARADASLTQTGIVTGSPAYLAPEVVTGGTATAASDVWSFGATVFHALSGRPPYAVGDNLLSTMYRIVHDEPPRLEGGGRLPALVEAMMQHEPAARPTMLEIERTLVDLTALEFSDDPATGSTDLESTQGFVAFSDDPPPTATTSFRPLRAPATTLPPPEPPVGPVVSDETSPRRIRLAAAAAAVALAVLMLFVVLGGGDDEGPDTAGAGTSRTAGSTTAEAVEGFAADYLTAADNDPRAGFAMLTPDYQADSGGFEGYDDFWGGVSGLDIQSLEGDPDDLTVSYTYSYDFEGETRTEDVTLQLEKASDSFLISGTA